MLDLHMIVCNLLTLIKILQYKYKSISQAALLYNIAYGHNAHILISRAFLTYIIKLLMNWNELQNK